MGKDSKLDIVGNNTLRHNKNRQNFRDVLTKLSQNGNIQQINEEELWEKFDIEQLISSQDFVKRSLIVLGKILLPDQFTDLISKHNIAFPHEGDFLKLSPKFFEII